MKAEKRYLIKLTKNTVGVRCVVEIGGVSAEIITIAHMPYKRACMQLAHIVGKRKVGKPDYACNPRRNKAVESEKTSIVYRETKTRKEVIITYYQIMKGVYLVEEYDINSHTKEYNIEEVSSNGERCHLCC